MASESAATPAQPGLTIGGAGEAFHHSQSIEKACLAINDNFTPVATHIRYALLPDDNNLDLASKRERETLAGNAPSYYPACGSFPNVIVDHNLNNYVRFVVYHDGSQVPARAKPSVLLSWLSTRLQRSSYGNIGEQFGYVRN